MKFHRATGWPAVVHLCWCPQVGAIDVICSASGKPLFHPILGPAHALGHLLVFLVPWEGPLLQLLVALHQVVSFRRGVVSSLGAGGAELQAPVMTRLFCKSLEGRAVTHAASHPRILRGS